MRVKRCVEYLQALSPSRQPACLYQGALLFSASRDLNPLCSSKGQLLLSVSPPLWDFEDDEDPAILEIVSEQRQKLPWETFLDFGPVLPTRYGVDQLELMVQSPLRVFAYWELRETTVVTALRCIPPLDRHHFQLFLRWQERNSAREQWLDPGTTDTWWFDTLPENRYQLELGLYWSEHGWLPLLSSSELVTPPFALGPRSEEEPLHIQPFLEDLVEQAGIGFQRSEPCTLSPANGETALRGSDTNVVDRTPSSELYPERQLSRVSQTAPSWLRPTSGW